MQRWRRNDWHRWLKRRLRAWTTLALLLVACGPVGCRSTDGGSSFRWPWQKEGQTGFLGMGKKPPPRANTDPFLPPVRSPDVDSGPVDPRADVSRQHRASYDSLVQIGSPQPLTLVSESRPLPVAVLTPEGGANRGIIAPSTHRREFRYIVLQQREMRSATSPRDDYHFLIGGGDGTPDGQVVVSDHWWRQEPIARTTGDNPYIDFGIVFAMEGDFNVAPPTPKQVESARRLLDHLQTEYQIPPYRVMLQNEVTTEVADGIEPPGRKLRIRELVPNR